MTCCKLGDEGQKGWVSWLWDQHSPVTLLLLPSSYPAQRLVQYQPKLLMSLETGAYAPGKQKSPGVGHHADGMAAHTRFL